MALKPTIYKFNVTLADLNNHHYPNLSLTVAQHPSETLERMLVRVMVFCLHSFDDNEGLLAFTKGLSSVEEPDLWQKTLDDQLLSWIDVGEPSFDRMKKACRLSKSTFVYSFNSKSDVWWKQNREQLEALPIKFFAFEWEQIKLLAKEIERKSTWSITISDESIFVTTASEQFEVNWIALK
ncbi:YaeQ family protein [Glaciecola sp. MF2-115]|uniref:YaeQ family protein n=1 Tax=Glaciecola sp. MF2-115 TaxID=3384827 RepID=UPI0039A12724